MTPPETMEEAAACLPSVNVSGVRAARLGDAPARGGAGEGEAQRRGRTLGVVGLDVAHQLLADRCPGGQVAGDAGGGGRGGGAQRADRQPDVADALTGDDHSVLGRPALHERAVCGDQLAAGVEREPAVAGVQGLAARADDEEAVARDHEVGRHTGGLRRPGGEVRADAGDLHPETDLGGVLTADGLLRHHRVAHELRERILELHGRGLEAGGVDVGDVVAGDVEHGLVRTQTRDTCEQRAEHGDAFLEGTGQDCERGARETPETASRGMDASPMVTSGTAPA